jgi:hypothetical protein
MEALQDGPACRLPEAARRRKGHCMKPLHSLRTALTVALSLVLALGIAVVALGFVNLHGAHAANTCTPTGYVRDNINLTAALIDPKGTVSGYIDASGCNIGVYYDAGHSGTVANAEISGANYYGVVNNGAKVDIRGSRIHNIGESPFNGAQHGVAIYFVYNSGARGSITENLIWYYQKGGIVVNGTGDNAYVAHNTVIGNGPVDYIAQNGIQIGYGATAEVMDNLVTGNSYTGAGDADDGGIIVVGGSYYGSPVTANVKIGGNVVIGNDIGIWLTNVDFDPNHPGDYNYYVPATEPTRIDVERNLIENDAVTNTTGYVIGAYQAGIADQGNYDRLVKNSICGVGYTPVATPPPYLYAIDDTATNNIFEQGNTTCLGGGSTITKSDAGLKPAGTRQGEPDRKPESSK